MAQPLSPRYGSGRLLLRLLLIAVFGLYLALAAFVFSHRKHGLDPAGYDFSALYAAGRLADAGRAADAYDDPGMVGAQRALFAGARTWLTWKYPPIFQLALAPLARLPYGAALLGRSALGAAAYGDGGLRLGNYGSAFRKG